MHDPIAAMAGITGVFSGQVGGLSPGKFAR
jgi:hypothetical protein